MADPRRDHADSGVRRASMMDVDSILSPSSPVPGISPGPVPSISTAGVSPASSQAATPSAEPARTCPYMPDLGLEVEDYQEFTWRIESFTALRNEAVTTRKVYSPHFTLGGEQWRLLMFPYGNNTDSLSVYLDHADIKSVAPKWHRCIQFAIRAQNPVDASVGLARDAHHRFVPDESDWGFSQFYRVADLTRAVPDQDRPIIENDSFVIVAYMRVIKDSVGTLWHTFANWDSREETGYIGLKNQGATCYMNSLLQSLYFINPFRKAVFQIPTDTNEPSMALALALQRLFYQLQYSATAADTRELTKSFGWDSVEAFMQHDVQEFNRVLQDSLELRMKKSAAEGAIERLFVGKMKSYIKCVNVSYESSREETFYDIQLNVKGKANLMESFQDYIAVEMLDGENKYQAENFGLQDAKKGVIFTKFPPVLHLQLKRFEYDFERDAMVKINDRHEYPERIDLSQFVDENAPKDIEQVYVLHGVLVHIGDVNGGHYCAFLKPDRNGKWFKFDDDRVTPVTNKEVFDDNFGGDLSGPLVPNTRQNRLQKRFTNAYMLVYIREADLDRILAPILPNDIPTHLRESIEKEIAEKERLQKEAQERHLFMDVKVLTSEDIKYHQGFDLYSYGPDSDCHPQVLRVRKEMLLSDFQKHAAEHFKLAPENIRFWTFYRRQNATSRPERSLDQAYASKTLEQISAEIGKGSAEMTVYMQIEKQLVHDVDGQLVYFPSISNELVMLWIKYYDPAQAKFQFMKPIHVKRQLKTEDLIPMLNSLCGNTPSTPIRIYEEIKPGMVDILKPKQTLAANEIITGDILCFQREVPKELEPSYEFPFAVGYYEYLQHRIFVRFMPRTRPTDEKEEEKFRASQIPFEDFKMPLSKKLTYDQFAERVAKQLELPDFLKLRFWLNPSGHDVPKVALKRNATQTLHEIITSNYYHAVAPVFWYEKLDISIVELDTKRHFRVAWVDHCNREGETANILIPKDGTVRNIIEATISKLNLAKPLERLRLVEVANNRMIRDTSMDQPVSSISDYGTQLCLEEVLEEEKPTSADEKLICVFHYSKDPMYSHSIPFRFLIRLGELMADLKKRIQARIGMGEKEFSKAKFTVVKNGIITASLEKDDAVLYDLMDGTEQLGIDHVDRSAASRRNVGLERAIKINN